MFKLNLLVLAKLNIPHFNVICDLLGSFISTFFYKYMWPQTSRSHVTRLQRSHAPFAVHLWTSGGAVTGTWTSSTLFLFLFESSHVCPINICEMRSFLYYQSVWDATKPIFYLHFVYEMKNLHLCVIQDGGEHVDFFSVESRRRSKKLKVTEILTSNNKLLTAVWRCSKHTRRGSKTLYH